MRIELENLEDGKGSFAHTYQPEELNLVDERVRVTEPIIVNGRIRSSGIEIQVSGRVETKVNVECDRCLKMIELPVSAGFKLQYITGQDYESSRAAELTTDEMGLSVFDGDAIDADEIVREQILLSVPDRALCDENCRGICSICGTNLNNASCECTSSEVDPRWEALKKLKSNL